jgi:hypothetical protein
LSFAVPPALGASSDLALVNRLTWGETTQDDSLNGQSLQAWEQQQLHPGDDGLPQEVQAVIAGMEISQKSLSQLNDELRQLQQAHQRAKDADCDTARQAHQVKLKSLMRQTHTSTC